MTDIPGGEPQGPFSSTPWQQVRLLESCIPVIILGLRKNILIFFFLTQDSKQEMHIEVFCIFWKTIKDSLYCAVQYPSFKEIQNKILSSELGRMFFFQEKTKQNNRCAIIQKITVMSLNIFSLLGYKENWIYFIFTLLPGIVLGF